MTFVHDPSFAPPAELPFPIGLSPFRQKGNAYLSDVRYLNATVDGGVEAILATIAEPKVRAFIRQPFRAADWYDAYPGMVLEQAVARARRVSFERQRRETGAWHAEYTARGMYGALLKIVSNESIARWGPHIAGIYFEFAKTETRVAGPRDIVARVRGVPRELVQWMMFACAGFSDRALVLAGARDAQAIVEDVMLEGRAHGRDLATIDLRMTWS